MTKPKKVEVIKERSGEMTGVLRERAMLARFATSRWYGRGADEEVVSDVRKKHEASGDIGTFTKRFMAREHLAPIDAVVNEARRYHKDRTLAWGDTGARLLAADLFFEYKKEMTAYEMRFYAAVEEFLAKYVELIKLERKRLNGLFKERDYPSLEELRAKFKFGLSIDPLPAAEDFRVDLGEEELRRIRGDIEQRVEQGMREASTEIWGRLEKLVSKVQERLSDNDAQVRESLFENLKELVAVIPRLNVTNDPTIAAMGERVTKDLLKGIDVEEIKDSPKVRSDVAKRADAILGAMKGFTHKKQPAAQA